MSATIKSNQVTRPQAVRRLGITEKARHLAGWENQWDMGRWPQLFSKVPFLPTESR